MGAAEAVIAMGENRRLVEVEDDKGKIPSGPSSDTIPMILIAQLIENDRMAAALDAICRLAIAIIRLRHYGEESMRNARFTAPLWSPQRFSHVIAIDQHHG